VVSTVKLATQIPVNALILPSPGGRRSHLSRLGEGWGKGFLENLPTRPVPSEVEWLITMMSAIRPRNQD
jgi:hypothetical protein